MTLTEALSQGAMVAVVGLATVFAVLIILMLVIIIMEKVFASPKEQNQIKKTDTVKAQTPAKPAAAETEDESELIAVLAAAVAASLNTSVYNLRIRSYRRIENNSTAWNKAGVKEIINSRDI